MSLLHRAQKNGNWTGKIEHLRLGATDVSGSHPLDAYPGRATWLDWPWKLHRWEDRNSGEVQFKLYNLARDPMEKNDVADRHEERVRKMREQLEQWQTSVIRSYNGEDY